MKSLAFIGAFLITFSASVTRAQTVDVFPNGCVIACLEFQVSLSLTRHGIWNRMVKVSFDNQKSGHALVVFALQDGSLMVYDVNGSGGSIKLGISQRDISSISIALKYQYEHMTTAVFLD